MFSIISIFILLLSGTLSPTVATPNQEDESASRSDSVGSENSDNTFSVSQVYAELYRPVKASNPANSSSVKLVEPQLKKSLSFNPKSPGGNSTFFNDQQPLQKSLSFKPPKTINSRINLLQESFKNSRNLSLKRDIEEKKKILDEKLENWFSSKKNKEKIGNYFYIKQIKY
ncbi:hypothetical protein GPALN_013136 [Globodera pallida]|nr:hypothetical protein GPALN_013136 [Globodera pallida]